MSEIFGMKRVFVIWMFLFSAFFCMTESSAQQVQWKAVCVGDSGAVELSWQSVSQMQTCELCVSATLAGPYIKIADIAAGSTFYRHPHAGAESRQMFYYLHSAYGNSDTVGTLFMGMENHGGGIANLQWLPPYYSGKSSSGCAYNLYRKGAGNDLVNTLYSLACQDTVCVCGDTLEYVLSTESGGCRFVSAECRDYFSDFTAPDTARLDSVSLHPYRHYCEIGWQPSPSGDAFGYIVYIYEQGIWQVLDTLPGAENTHYIDSVYADGSVRQYRIATMDTCRNASPLGEIHHTLNLSASVHKCDSMVNLSWNAYEHMPGGTAAFDVFASTDGETFFCIGSGGKENRFTCRQLDVMQEYTFYVRVWNADRSVSSTTALTKVQFHRKVGSGEVFLQSVSVNPDNEIEIKVYVNDTVDYRKVLLQRQEVPGGEVVWQGSRQKDGHTYSWTPYGLDVQQPHYFTAFLTDECDFPFAVSVTAANIVLNLAEADGENQLSWPAYQGFGRQPDAYAVYRRTVSAADFECVAQQSPVKLDFADKVDDLPLEEVYYRVSAKGTNAGLPFSEECFSNTVSVTKAPQTYIPNSFIPESSIEENRVFRPVNLYVDASEYTFTIFDRWGQIVYETHQPDEGWDGTIQGQPARMGIYVYQLTYRISKKKMYSRRGMVNLIR